MTISLSELGERLEVEARAFDERVGELMAELSGKRITIVPLPDGNRRRDQDSARAFEQNLARCFEFLRARAIAALANAGITVPAPSGSPPASDLIRVLAGQPGDGAQAEEARHCLEELEALRAQYVDAMRYLVPVLIERYQGHGVDRDDLIQEGFLGLLRAIDGYDWRRGVRFSTYAKYWIQERVLNALYDQSRTVRVPAWIQKLWRKVQRARADDAAEPKVATPELAAELDVSERRLQRVLDSKRSQVSLDATAGDEDGGSAAGQVPDPRATTEFASDREDLLETLENVLAELDERQALVLRGRFGLDGGAPRSLQELGVELGVSAERVRQIQQKALGQLEKHKRLASLFESLD